MINHHGSLLPGVSVGLWFAIAGAVVLLVLTIVGFFAADGDYAPLSFVAFLFLAGLVVGCLFGYYPYKGDYHRLQPVTGTVKVADTRFMAASQYVVITYDTGLIVRCDDSRCATVKPGDSLRLLCTKEHDFGSPLELDGWGCRWGQK